MQESSSRRLGCKGVFHVKKNMAWTCEMPQKRGFGENNGIQTKTINGSSGASTTRITTIRLQDIYDPKPQPQKVPVRIRPPGPRPPSVKELNSKPSFPGDPPTKTIMRRRAQSLPLSADRKKEFRSLQVRFVDSLGLELEEVKVFKAQEHPSIPEHVLFRLLMSSEHAFGRSMELSLPYFKPCFPENMGIHPDFLEKLCTQSVCLEQVLCSEQGITGTIQVLNLAYEKKVTVHYSFTNWRSQTETTASWLSSGYCRDGDHNAPEADLFRFRLPVPPFILQPGAVLEFAICYSVKGFKHWDNNNGQNYKLSCHSYKVTVPRECEDSMQHFT
nr:protein phosphatase 1 regulatory subunit 3D-like isoform X1 [Labrus bergylta]